MHDDVSGYVAPTEFTVSSRFEDLTPLPDHGGSRLVRARRYGRLWLLKGLTADCADRAACRALLRKEFDILAPLQHAGIVAAAAMEDVPGLGTCIVMEWIDGTTLAEWLRGEHTRREKVEVVRQVAGALAYLHARQVVHRDLKPSNIMVTRGGLHVKLIDFGLADTASYAILKQPAGTAGYVSPEQAASAGADERNDLYSLGCIMAEMGLGRRYRRLVQQLRTPIGERLQSAEALLAALRRTERRALMRVRLAVISATVAAVVLPLLIVYSKSGEAVRPTAAAPAPSATSAPKDSAAASPVLQQGETAARKETVTSENSVPDGAALTRCLAEACAHIDGTWRGQRMDEPADTVEKSRRFMLFYNACNAYIARLPHEPSVAALSEAERRTVADSAAAYFAHRYVAPFLGGGGAPR